MESDFARMQREATERLIKMSQQSSSKNTMPPTPNFVNIKSNNQNKVADNSFEKASNIQGMTKGNRGNSTVDFFSNLFKDDDTILLFGIIFLLFRDNSDPLLMLALLYILM